MDASQINEIKHIFTVFTKELVRYTFHGSAESLVILSHGYYLTEAHVSCNYTRKILEKWPRFESDCTVPNFNF